MEIRNTVKNASRTLILAFSLLFFSFFFEPAIRDNLTFAVTYFENTKVETEKVETSYIKDEAEQSRKPEKTHAPEPSSLFIIVSGIGAMVVRFARKSFDKFKRGCDILLACLGMFVTSPLILFAAAFIRLTSKGPVLYKQNRVGKNGEIFQIYKLRTMCIDAEKDSGAVWARENDPRITSIGRILRKTHIDEIPQLINVLKGEMSIVGPRPERPEMVRSLKELIVDYEKRLEVKPGITGLAQVWHKYDETVADVKKKIKYDLLYIKRMCLLVDLRVLAQTVVVVLTGRGAR